MRRRETQTECNNERQSILLSHEYDMLKHKEHLGGIDASTSSSSPAPTLRFFPPPMNRTPLDRVGDPAPSDEVVAAFCFRVTLTNRTEGGSHTPTTTLCRTTLESPRPVHRATTVTVTVLASGARSPWAMRGAPVAMAVLGLDAQSPPRLSGGPLGSYLPNKEGYTNVSKSIKKEI